VNVTISLPEELVRQARHRAVDKRMSLSRWVASVLEEELTKRERLRQEAGERMIARMTKGYPLNMPDIEHRWTRDELHER
jgi:hypothetical protein